MAGWAALASFTVVVASIAGRTGTGTTTLGAVLGVAALVCALVALGFLRRAWADPEVTHDKVVVRARRLSEAALNAWAVACIPNVVAVFSPAWAEAMSWLPVVAYLAAGVATALFVAMLVAAGRWNPGDR